MKGWRSAFDSLRALGADDVDLHRLEGFTDRGGHHAAVFAPAESHEFVVRPWESDMAAQETVGNLGETSGKKVYAADEHELSRGDRIHYRGGAFRLMNPQFDQLNDLERWDAQADEREFVTTDELDEDVTVHPPDEDGYGGY